MTSTRAGAERILASLEPFCQLPAERRERLAASCQAHRYGLGHTLVAAGEWPAAVWIVLRGSLRSLGPLDGADEPPRTLEKLEAGAIAGWISLLHGTPLEHLRTASELDALVLPAAELLDLLAHEPALQQWACQQLPAAELLGLLRPLAEADPLWRPALADWPHTRAGARLLALSPGTPLPSTTALEPGLRWFVSHPAAAPLALNDVTTAAGPASQPATGWRLIGLLEPSGGSALALATTTPLEQAPLALTPVPPQLPLPPHLAGSRALAAAGRPPLQLGRAAGPRQIPLAICLALASHFGVPANRDALREQIEAILQRQSQLNLINYGQLIAGLGLRVALCNLPLAQLRRAPTPAVLMHRGRVGLLDGIDADGQARLLEPELGAVRIPLAELGATELGNTELELLLIERHPGSKSRRFSWGWYGPYLRPHRRELIEVLAASAVVNTLALVTPLGMQVLIDQVAGNPQGGSALISIASLLLLASLVGAVVRSVRSLIFTNVANSIDQSTKSTILDQLVRLPQGFFDSRPVGRITFYFSQLDRLREFLIGQSLTTVVDFGFSLLYIAVLLAINPLLTLVSLSTLPLFLILALVSNPLIDTLLRRSIAEAIRTYSYLTEAITGIQTIKSQNAELKTRWEFQNRYARFIGEDFKLRVSGETIGSLATFINELNGLLVIGFGIHLVMQNQLTLGAFIAFRIISGYITGPLVKLVQTWQQFKQASESLRIVGDVVDRPTEQTDAEATNIPMPPLQGQVQVQGVDFRFSNDGPLVLHNVNLEVPAGCFVGMVGGSGSGKSTVLKLLPRFYRPEKGKVLIDGYDINKVELYSLRRQIGVVPQDSLLFDGTIKDNLLLVKPDATADELIRAARIACAHDFIMELPQGYNTPVGERGAGLSGGQRQRMALARAVLQNPRLLILDEATSALDARTERQVCLNLFEAFRGRTVFFITHRLSTVRPADLIVLMDRGAVMETGNHSQLMAQRGWYYALFQSQNQEGLS